MEAATIPNVHVEMTNSIGVHIFEGRRRDGDLQWDETPKTASLDELCQKTRTSKGVTIGYMESPPVKFVDDSDAVQQIHNRH